MTVVDGNSRSGRYTMQLWEEMEKAWEDDWNPILDERFMNPNGFNPTMVGPYIL